MPNWLLRLAAREWAGLALAAIVAAAGAAGWRWGTPAVQALGAVLLVLAVLLAAGSLRHLAQVARTRRRFPPPGRMVDVGGYRVHVLAEGDAGSAHPLVMFGGGHSPGLAMKHLHDALAAATRSILIDRSGTGWSDTGPIPHTTAAQADEAIRALEAAGETGPFVFAGYSFGGLLVANIARRYPEKVARLILIDPTPLETIVFGPRFGAIRTMLRAALAAGLTRLVGLRLDAEARSIRDNPAHAEAVRAFREMLGDAATTMRAVDVTAGAQLATYSIFHELLGTHVGSVGWETVVYDGDLGDMDVWLVAPGDAREVTAEPEVGGAVGGEEARMLNFFARSRERYMAVSSRSKRIVAPAGSTHQFVYTHPEFVVGVLKDAVVRDSEG